MIALIAFVNRFLRSNESGLIFGHFWLRFLFNEKYFYDFEKFSRKIQSDGHYMGILPLSLEQNLSFSL